MSRTIHVTSSLSRQGGGIPPVIWSLVRHTQTLGNESLVAGLRDEFFETDAPGPQIQVIAGNICGPKAVGFSPQLNRLLRPHVRPTDVIHTHGLWMYPGTLAFQLSQTFGCKRMISPHGMLEPWALKHSGWKKRAADWMFERRNLETADCLHALCQTEAEHFRRYGLRNPIAVIPNGVEPTNTPPGREQQNLRRDFPPLAAGKLLLFLSRIHPKKGLVDLLQAWARIQPQKRGWALAIAGPDEVQHESGLRRLTGELALTQSVQFLGPVYGDKKARLLSIADAFILPSHSEGFSIALLEAAAAGLPVVLTRECNFPELAAAGAAFETGAGAAGLESALRNLLALSDEQRTAMGLKGQNLVQQVYSWPAIAREMSAVYNWLAHGNSKPQCVRLN